MRALEAKEVRRYRFKKPESREVKAGGVERAMRAAMPKFSLSYFPVRARAECIRMCVPLSHKCRVVQHSTTGLLAPLTLVASLTSTTPSTRSGDGESLPTCVAPAS